MSLLKKALAGVCSLMIAASAFTAFAVVASADEVKPVLYPVVTVDEAAKTAKVEVYVEGLPTVTPDDDPTFVQSLAMQVDVSSYSNTSIAGLTGKKLNTWKKAHYTGFDATVAGINSSTANPGYLSVLGSYTGGSAMVASGTAAVKAKMLICTIADIDLTDDALKNGFTVNIANDETNFVNIVLNNEYFGTSDAYEIPYKQGNGADTLTVNSASWKPATPEEPKPDYVYDEKNPSATNWKAADTDVAPSVYEGTDGSKAVGAKATVNPGSDKNTYTGLVWKVKSADGAKTYTYTQGVNITGAADFVYGIVINGATEGDVDLNSFGVAVK